jgi:hypothetical protein
VTSKDVMIASTNPYTGAEIARFEFHSAVQVDAALGAAVMAQRQWRARPRRWPCRPAVLGGIRRSDYDRELGIREFVNIKTLWTGPARS